MLFKHLFFVVLNLTPPLAQKEPKTLEAHGDKRVDDYYWLKNKQSEEVKLYLEKENNYVDEVMASTKDLQKELYSEFLARLPECDESVPTKKKDNFYYTTDPKDKPYGILYRKKGSLSAPAEVIFDENEFAKGKFFSVGGMALSYDQNILAFTEDFVGNEEYTLKFKDLNTGEILNDAIAKVGGSAVFANDNQTVFYLKLDETNRPYQLYRHKLGSDSKEDVLLFEEKDPCFSIGIGKSNDSQIIYLESGSSLTTTTFYINANTPEASFVEILPKVNNVKYLAEHGEGNFYIVTNSDAPNFKVITLDGKVILPEREDTSIEDAALFGANFALFEMRNGLPIIEILNVKTGQIEKTLSFDEPTYSLSRVGGIEYDSEIIRFTLSSFVTPNSTYDYNLKTGELILRKKEFVGQYSAEDYQEKRIFAKAPDGTLVPISLVYKKGVEPRGLYLKGYGAYGMKYLPHFSRASLSLLNRGVTIAIAHIRGGGEFGRKWYDAGRLFCKKNSFTDFIAASETLIKEGYATKDNLIIQGRSAGGLLMGAVLNMRPDLFHAAVVQYPFLDVLTTMSDPTLPLTTGEYNEWGNPSIEKQYFYMKSYSPYDNIKSQAYPNILLMGGFNDVRVLYTEPAKFAAKLRANKTDSNLLLLKTIGTGHFGAADRFNALEEEAFVDAFILKMLQ